MLQAPSIAETLEANEPSTGALEKAAWILRLSSPLSTGAVGPLSGLRFAVKDNIDVAGIPTTAACPAFAYVPPCSASVVQRLFEAGAQLVGKTNLDQFACGLNGTRSPYGPVPNAFNSAYISGGSSSGSAYVVARGEVDFALGTDTAGSGRVPAGLNNVVGLKPSKGLISMRGIVPAMPTMDCVSVFARTVATAVHVLQSAIGFDVADPHSRTLSLVSSPFADKFCFGVPDALEFFGDRLAKEAFDDAVERLRALGGEPVTVDYAPFAAAAEMLYGSALVSERYAAIRGFFDHHEAEVIEPVRSILASGRNYCAADLADAQQQLRRCAQQAAGLWSEMDVLVVPTAPTIYTIDAIRADPVALNRRLGTHTNFVNPLDYAAVSVPSSIRSDGLPFGITLIGPCGSDWQLAELGQRYHHATGLTLGATGYAQPPIQPLAGNCSQSTVKLAVVGAHLSGMPLNSQLTERGAVLFAKAATSPDYRLFALPGTHPPKPGLMRVASGRGAPIVLEVWEMPLANYGSFVALIPAPLGIGTLTLSDGSSVQGFICEALATDGATDITHFGGWRAYVASLSRS